MMKDKFDIKELHKRIEEVKEETQYLTKFTHEFLECLIERHNIQDIIWEEQEFEDVPNEIVELLKNGEVPTEEQLSVLDSETQNFLLKECVFICGMGAVSIYSHIEEIKNNEEYDDEKMTIFDSILEMSDESPGHYIGMYLIAALSLLLGKIPSYEMIEVLTKNFDSSQDNLQRCYELYNEFCLSVYNRYMGDKEIYFE